MKVLLAVLSLAASACCCAAERFTTVRVNVREENIELFLSDESGKPFNRFDRLASWLKARDKQLRFAMNAGMFHADFSPVGEGQPEDRTAAQPRNVRLARRGREARARGAVLQAPRLAPRLRLEARQK